MHRYLACCLVLLSHFGCNSQPAEKVVSVRGKVTNAGAPLVVSGREIGLGRVEIAFHRLQADGTVDADFESAAADEQGNFTMRGRDGKGIQPGKYRIIVRQWDPDPTDKLAGKFSLENSKIEREVGASETTIEIDVSKPQG
jgi:hypothetical protein